MGEMVGEVEVIHLWSSPRSVSTSLMYSFAQRDDMEVVDEPLYPNYLRVTGAKRPYREELMSKMESDGNKIIRDIIFGPGKKKYRFCKHIANQRLPGLTEELMKKGKHFILMRNPIDVLTSYDNVVHPSFVDLGWYSSLVSIYSELRDEGKTPPVIDSDLLRKDPEATVRGLCDNLGIPFQAAMLKWEPGPKSFDGMWAPYWYKSTHKSTGFEPPKKYPSPFPPSLYDLLEQCLPFYEFLRRHVRQTIESPHPNLPVPANEKLLAWVGDQIVPRESAKVSVFDSIVQGGDGVWEGLRIYKGKIFKLEEHLESFLVKKGHLATPHADYCLPGITRATVMELAVKENLLLVERRISLSEFHTADEVFTTGTMGELSPVIKIDGRTVGDGNVGTVTQRLQNAYAKLCLESGVPIPTYQHT